MLDYFLIAKQASRGLHLRNGDYDEIFGAACEGLSRGLTRMQDASEPEQAAFLRRCARNAALDAVRHYSRGMSARMHYDDRPVRQDAMRGLEDDSPREFRASRACDRADPEAVMMAHETMGPLMAVLDAVHADLGPDPVATLSADLGPSSTVERNLLDTLREIVLEACGLRLTRRQMKQALS